jgi:hypothetical protein
VERFLSLGFWVVGKKRFSGLSAYTERRGLKVQLSVQETVLLEDFRRLPPNAAEEFSALVRRLAESGRIDWSDSWSDEDLREFTARSVRRFEEEEGSV